MSPEAIRALPLPETWLDEFATYLMLVAKKFEESWCDVTKAHGRSIRVTSYIYCGDPKMAKLISICLMKDWNGWMSWAIERAEETTKKRLA